MTLANGIATPTCKARVLDLSWNGFRGEAQQAFARCLEWTESLTHVDLSHNHLGKEDLKILGEALAGNTTLMGLHVEGQEAHCDSVGFLVDDANQRRASAHEAIDAGHVFTRARGRAELLPPELCSEPGDTSCPSARVEARRSNHDPTF